MKATVTSTFHSGMSETFVGLKEGPNYRKYRNLCGDCQCGWPLAHVEWHVQEGFEAVVDYTPEPNEIRISIYRKGRA